MENLKFLMLCVAFSILFVGIRAESLVEEAILKPAADSNLKLEIKKLESKITSLESSLTDKSKELKVKDEKIAALDTLLQEKTTGIGRLESEVELLMKKGSAVAEEAAGEAHARVDELENEVEKLKAEIDILTKNNQLSEARASEAEKKVEGLEQQLGGVHGAWLPPWLAKQISYLQEISFTEWDDHGKPILDLILQMSSEMSANSKKWAEPHIASVQTKWIPVAKERWTTFKTSIEPHVQTLSSKSDKTYKYCINKVTPHIVKVHKFTTPYIQKARKLSKPYFDQIAVITKPHVENLRTVLNPYTNPVIHAFGILLESATTYHHQVEDAIQEKLKKHELTALARKDFTWFGASALLALPIILAYKILRFVFCKRPIKLSETQASNGRNGHRKHKRRHVEKQVS